MHFQSDFQSNMKKSLVRSCTSFYDNGGAEMDSPKSLQEKVSDLAATVANLENRLNFLQGHRQDLKSENVPSSRENDIQLLQSRIKVLEEKICKNKGKFDSYCGTSTSRHSFHNHLATPARSILLQMQIFYQAL